MICLTGASGFVGLNLVDFFQKKSIEFQALSRNEIINDNISINPHVSCLIHLAGIAHDISNKYQENDYYNTNYLLTKKLFDYFLESNIEIFIFFSSIKAVADFSDSILNEYTLELPSTAYGRSKLLAEEYILSKFTQIDSYKRVYIIRPSLIYGPSVKGNLRLLYEFMKKGYPWPFGAFANKRSYCSIDNVKFVINEFYTRKDIESGIYNLTDSDFISTNELVKILATVLNKNLIIFNIPQFLIKLLARLGDLLLAPFNSKTLRKLTASNQVSNAKLLKALRKELPILSRNGLESTFKSYESCWRE